MTEADIARNAAAVRRCVFCGSPDINLWESWNTTGEWTCYECSTPGDDCADDGDWI